MWFERKLSRIDRACTYGHLSHSLFAQRYKLDHLITPDAGISGGEIRRIAAYGAVVMNLAAIRIPLEMYAYSMYPSDSRIPNRK